MAKRRRRRGMHGVDSIATIDSWGIDAIDAVLSPSQFKEMLYAAGGGGVGLGLVDTIIAKQPVGFFKAGMGRIIGKALLGVGGAIALSKYLNHAAGLGWVGAVGGSIVQEQLVRFAPSLFHGMSGLDDEDDLLLDRGMSQDPDLLPSDLSDATGVETASPTGFADATMVQESHPTGFADDDGGDLSWMS